MRKVREKRKRLHNIYYRTLLEASSSVYFNIANKAQRCCEGKTTRREARALAPGPRSPESLKAESMEAAKQKQKAQMLRRKKVQRCRSLGSRAEPGHREAGPPESMEAWPPESMKAGREVRKKPEILAAWSPDNWKSGHLKA